MLILAPVLAPILAPILALGLLAPSVRAEEPRLARILTIDAARVTLSLEPRQGGTAGARSLVVPRETLASGMEVGTLVRLWPGASRGSDEMLSGARLEPLDGDLAARDRTGVRARLMYGGQRGVGGGLGGGRGGGGGGR